MVIGWVPLLASKHCSNFNLRNKIIKNKNIVLLNSIFLHMKNLHCLILLQTWCQNLSSDRLSTHLLYMLCHVSSILRIVYGFDIHVSYNAHINHIVQQLTRQGKRNGVVNVVHFAFIASRLKKWTKTKALFSSIPSRSMTHLVLV